MARVYKLTGLVKKIMEMKPMNFESAISDLDQIRSEIGLSKDPERVKSARIMGEAINAVESIVVELRASLAASRYAEERYKSLAGLMEQQ